MPHRWSNRVSRRRAPPPPRFWPKPRRAAFAARPFLLFAIAGLIWPTLDARLVEPPAFLATDPEPVDRQFTRCGQGPRSNACVVDGDTIRIDGRRIRIVGIDAPEVEARCPAEAAAAEASTQRLQALLNEGPFEMIGRIDAPTDRYGRELKTLRRFGETGEAQSIAAILREEGHARRYLGGFREGWC